jgi:hypothetical protein
VRGDGGADHPTRLNGDLQSTMPPQAEANVVGKVFIAVTRVEHYPRLQQEQKQNNRE